MKKQKVSKDFYVDWHVVAPGIWRIKDIFVNIYLVHNPQDNTWVMIDAGLPSSAKKIIKVTRHLFWPESRPSGIILTHAHFDHTGSLQKLAEEWDVPVYAHSMERPYLTGISAYPPPDPSVGGGLMSLLSFLFPRGPINIANRFIPLPSDGTLPGLTGWKYYHTPGHAPGHISLMRQSDRVLIAGDAVVTTNQESAVAVMLQSPSLQGPPKYFTYNWMSSERSAKIIAALEPSILATGHGKPMEGTAMRKALHQLADHFSELAVPDSGRYVNQPALVNQDGVQYIPPSATTKLILTAAAIAASAVLGYFFIQRSRKP